MVSEEIDSFMWQRFSVHCDGTEDYPATETSTRNLEAASGRFIDQHTET
jgi:hypothetical protein